MLSLTLIIPQNCYVCLFSLINTTHTHTHTHIYIIYIHIYIYIYTYIYIYIYIYLCIYNIYIYIYIYTYIKLNRYWCVLRYTYTIHYAYAYNYIQYVLSEKEDRQHLLKAKVKLAKYPASATYCFYCPLTTLRADYYALSPLWAEGNHQHLLRA